MSEREFGGQAPEARAGVVVALGGGTELLIKAAGAETGGTLALLEYRLMPGGGSGLHAHSREDESFYLLSGAISFQIGEATVTAGPGEFVHVPRGVRHAFLNAGEAPAIALIVLTPAGLEQFFVDLATLAADAPNGALAPELIAALAERYGLDFGV